MNSFAKFSFSAALILTCASGSLSAAAVTATPTTLAANSTGNITIKVTGLASAGETVRIERILDLNANSTADVGEPLVQSFLVTDGQVTSFGGVRNLNIPGDDDSVANEITTNISLPTSPETGRTAGAYLVRVSSPTSGFSTTSTTLTVTQPAYGQSVSGQVTDGTSPVSFAVVAALVPPGGDYTASVVSDASGNYTLNLPVGSYALVPSKAGFVASMSTAPSFFLDASQVLTGQNPTLTAATRAISGTVRDASGSPTLGGVQLFARSTTGDIATALSDSTGNYTLPALPGQWTIDVSSTSANTLGRLAPNSSPSASTTAGNVTLDIPLAAATSLVYGTVRDPLGNPLPGVLVESADDPNSGIKLYSSNSRTDADGKYFLGAAGTTGWRVRVNAQAALNGHIMPDNQWTNPSPGTAVVLNFSANQVTAHLQGTVTNNGTAVAGAPVTAYVSSNDIEVSTTTDSNGYFDLAVMGETWDLEIDGEWAQANNLLFTGRTETISANQTISGIIWQGTSTTGTISGSVRDPFNNPVTTEPWVYAYTTINGTYYEVGANSDPSGNYSLKVLGGYSWLLGADGFGDDKAIIPQPNATATILRSAIPGYPTSQSVPSGGNAIFRVTVDAPSPTIQWQRLPRGADAATGWADITNNSTYSGANTANLTVSPATAAMTGDQFRCAVSYTFNGTTPITNISDSTQLYVTVAHLTGTLLNNGTPVVGASVSAFPSFQWPNFTVTTDAGGHFDIPVTATGTWHVSVAGTWASQNNMIATSAVPADVSAGTDVTGIVLKVLSATGTITGSVKDAGGNSLANAFVYANTSIGGVFYNVNAQTNAGGNYSLPVVDGTWNVGVFAPGVSFAGKQISIVGSAQANFTAATAHFQGTMTNNGTAVPYMAIFAVPMNGNLAGIVSATTDASGNFDLAVTSGSWAIRISQGWANSLNLVGPSIYQTANSTTISGIAYPVLSGTASIYGNVRDASGNPVANTNVWASTTIDGVEYNGSSHTDASGTYYFPALSGRTWAVDATAAGYSAQQIAVSDLTLLNFGPSPHSVWQSQFSAGEIATGRTGLTADFDRDGVANLIEYAFGKNPKAADSAGISEDVVSGKLQISFPCDSNRTDIIYTVQASSNLTTWTDIATSVRGATAAPVYDAQSNPLSTVTDTGTGLRPVTVADAVATGSRTFQRVKVSDPALPLPTPTPYPPLP